MNDFLEKTLRELERSGLTEIKHAVKKDNGESVGRYGVAP